MNQLPGPKTWSTVCPAVAFGFSAEPLLDVVTKATRTSPMLDRPNRLSNATGSVRSMSKNEGPVPVPSLGAPS